MSDAPVSDYASVVAERRSDDNLAAVAGVTSRALEMTRSQAVAVELRGMAVPVTSAALRLGRLTPLQSQSLLSILCPFMDASCEAVLNTGLEEAFASMPELEISAMAHRRQEIRHVAT